jgi:hypothetical protein
MTSIGINHTYQFFPWKGKTIFQITAGLKRNSLIENQNTALKKPLFFKPLPINLYRKEIATTQKSMSAGSRASIKLRDFETPGGIVNTAITCNPYDLVNTLELNIPNDKGELPGTSSCNRDQNCYSKVTNALARVRSSGIVKPSYYASSEQYLAGRNRTFKQNQFHYIRQGNPAVKPGSADALSKNNVYSAQGLNHCSRVKISAALANNTFQYIWIDSVTYTVIIADGDYDIYSLNQQLANTLQKNNHYFILNSTRSSVYTLSFSYNVDTSAVLIDILPISTATFPVLNYSIPVAATWTNGSTVLSPQIVVQNNGFSKVIGFSPNTYGVSNASAPQEFRSSFNALITPAYVSTYYKPNNSKFATQGGVSASSLIARLKYDTITDNAYKYTAAYGLATANALAYGVPEGGYTIKDRIGYPNKRTPIIPKYGASTCKTCVSAKENPV